MLFASRPRLMRRQSPASPRAHRTAARGKLYGPLRLERLEERCLLATTLTGNGPGTEQLSAAYGQLLPSPVENRWALEIICNDDVYCDARMLASCRYGAYLR